MSSFAVSLLLMLVSSISFSHAAETNLVTVCGELLAAPVAPDLVNRVAAAVGEKFEIDELLEARAKLRDEQAPYLVAISKARAREHRARMFASLGPNEAKEFKIARQELKMIEDLERRTAAQVDQYMTEDVERHVLEVAVEVEPEVARLVQYLNELEYVVRTTERLRQVIEGLTHTLPRATRNPLVNLRARWLRSQADPLLAELDTTWPQVFRYAHDRGLETAAPTVVANVRTLEDYESLSRALTTLGDEARSPRDLLRARADELIRGVFGVFTRQKNGADEVPPVETIVDETTPPKKKRAPRKKKAAPRAKKSAPKTTAV